MASLGATRSMSRSEALHRRRSCRRAAPSRRAPAVPASRRSSRFSTSSRRRSSARFRMTSSSAVSMGFWKKSKAPSAIAASASRPLPLARHHHDRRLRVAPAHVTQQIEPLLDLSGGRQAAGRRDRDRAPTRRARGPCVASRAAETANFPFSAQVSCSSRNGIVLDDDDPAERPRRPSAHGDGLRGRRAARAARAVPPPGCERIRIVPRWKRTIWLAVARPSPTPCGLGRLEGPEEPVAQELRRHPGAVVDDLHDRARARAAGARRVAAHEDLALRARPPPRRSRAGSRRRRPGSRGRPRCAAPARARATPRRPGAAAAAGGAAGRSATWRSSPLTSSSTLIRTASSCADEAADDALQPLDRRGQKIPDRLAELRDPSQCSSRFESSSRSRNEMFLTS